MGRLGGFAVRTALVCGASLAPFLGGVALAQSPVRAINIPAESLDHALRDLARQSGVNVLFNPDLTRGRRARAVKGTMSVEDAARALVGDGGLHVSVDPTGAIIVGEAAPTPSPDASSQAAVDYGDIVVTARKRSERLIDVPSAITAIPASELRRTQSNRFEDYLTKVPGANFLSSGEGTTQIVLRGITAGSLQASSTVAIYVDEAPYGSSTAFAGGATGAPDLDPSDLERVEVLRGPQGTLYGANALGGVIKFVTAKPDTQRFSGRLAAGAAFVDGGGDGYNVSGAANIPISTDTLAVRVSAYARRDPGYIDDSSRDLENTNYANVAGGRAALLYKPTDTLSISLSAMAQNLHLNNLSAEDVNEPGGTPIYGDLDQSRFIDSGRRYHYRLYNGTLNWDFGWATLVSSTSYGTFRSSVITDASQAYGAAASFYLGIPGLGAKVDQPVHQTKLTEEIRLQSASDQPLEWRAGLFYDRERSLQTQSVSAFEIATLAPVAAPDLFNFGLHDRYREFAGFGDLTYHFTDRFALTVGARYSHNRQKFTETQTGFALPVFTAGRTTRDSSWTWLVNPEFKITPDTMLYARIATGYRPGGPTLFIPGSGGTLSPTFNPDTLTSYELGVKSSLLDRRLTLEADVFDIEWRKIQLNETVAGLAYITNGGKARSKGVEASATFQPSEGFRLSGNVTYTDARLREDIPLAGGFDDDRLPATPHWNAAAEASYEWRVGDDWRPFVGASVRHVGDRWSDFGLLPAALGGGAAPRYPLGAYTVGDLRAGIAHDGVTLTAYVKNVGDSRGIVALAPNVVQYPGFPFSAAILQPRTFGIDLSVDF